MIASIRQEPRGLRWGFTLLELIVVITIIGLLSTIVVVSTSKIPAWARSVKVKADMTAILKTAKSIHAVTGRYPQLIEEMVRTEDREAGPIVYLDGVPEDPWQNDYVYGIVDDWPQVVCLGSDRAEGGQGEAADVVMPAPRD